MTYSEERIKFSNQQVYWYFYIMGWGKTGPAHSFPDPKCSELFIYLSYFWIILLFHCILTLINDLFQRENQFLKPTSLFIFWYFYIMGWGKTGPVPSPHPHPNVSIFLFIFHFLDYATVSSYLNTYE